MRRHNIEKTFLIWVNEEDHTRVISMEKGGNMKRVFERFCRGLKEVRLCLCMQGDNLKQLKEIKLNREFGELSRHGVFLRCNLCANVILDHKKLLPANLIHCMMLAVCDLIKVLDIKFDNGKLWVCCSLMALWI